MASLWGNPVDLSPATRIAGIPGQDQIVPMPPKPGGAGKLPMVVAGGRKTRTAPLTSTAPSIDVPVPPLPSGGAPAAVAPAMSPAGGYLSAVGQGVAGADIYSGPVKAFASGFTGALTARQAAEAARIKAEQDAADRASAAELAKFTRGMELAKFQLEKADKESAIDLRSAAAEKARRPGGGTGAIAQQVIVNIQTDVQDDINKKIDAINKQEDFGASVDREQIQKDKDAAIAKIEAGRDDEVKRRIQQIREISAANPDVSPEDIKFDENGGPIILKQPDSDAPMTSVAPDSPYAVNDQTGEMMQFDGTKWVPMQ